MSNTPGGGAATVVQPQGPIAAAAAGTLREQLRQLIAAGEVHLVIDFRDVVMIDSMGIGVLIAAYNSVRSAGGSLQVIQVSPEIGSLFKTMRLDRHFEVRIVE